MEEREHVTDEGTTCWCDPEVLRVEGRVHRAETIATLTARVQGLEADTVEQRVIIQRMAAQASQEVATLTAERDEWHRKADVLQDAVLDFEADRDYYKEALEFVAENGSGSNVPDEWPVWAEEKLHQRRHQN